MKNNNRQQELYQQQVIYPQEVVETFREKMNRLERFVDYIIWG